MKIQKKIIQKIFEKLNVYQFESIYIYSDLLKLFLNQPKSEIPNYIEALKIFVEDLAINQKTVILPSFTYQFSSNKIYDITKTKPETGILPNLLLKSKFFKRTLSPMTSHLISGNKIPNKFYECTKTTFGQDSIYVWLIENNALLLSLGPSLANPNHGWVIVHHAEEMMKVPYRHFKKFDGKIYDNSKYIGKCSQEHYVRSDPQRFNDYSKVNQYLFKNGLITESNFENIIAHSVQAKDVYSVIKNLIKKNPNSLLAQA